MLEARGDLNMKVTGMCLPENENRGIRWRICWISEKEGGHWVCDPKKLCLFWCELPKNTRGGHLVKIFVKFEWKITFFTWKLAKILKCMQNATKNWNFTLKFWKRSHLVWTVVKNGVIGCKICEKRGHNTGRWYRLNIRECPPPSWKTN